MQRRKFLALSTSAAITSAFLSARKGFALPAAEAHHVYRSCSTHSPTQQTSPAAPALTPLTPITFELLFERRGGLFHRTRTWTDDQKNRLNQAKAYVEQVWSSREFRDKVTALPSLIWQDPQTITGADLYAKLIRNPKKQMHLTVNDTPQHLGWFGGELAKSSEDGYTQFQQSYLDDTRTTLADLVNTISHEYTHYADSLASWDAGHSDELKDYVSYGTGCLTQNLAFPDDTCSYDPNPAPNS